jgi:hypothetical protein
LVGIGGEPFTILVNSFGVLGYGFIRITRLDRGAGSIKRFIASFLSPIDCHVCFGNLLVLSSISLFFLISSSRIFVGCTFISIGWGGTATTVCRCALP